jgi:hypothetical protein
LPTIPNSNFVENSFSLRQGNLTEISLLSKKGPARVKMISRKVQKRRLFSINPKYLLSIHQSIKRLIIFSNIFRITPLLDTPGAWGGGGWDAFSSHGEGSMTRQPLPSARSRIWETPGGRHPWADNTFACNQYSVHTVYIIITPPSLKAAKSEAEEKGLCLPVTKSKSIPK